MKKILLLVIILFNFALLNVYCQDEALGRRSTTFHNEFYGQKKSYISTSTIRLFILIGIGVIIALILLIIIKKKTKKKVPVIATSKKSTTPLNLKRNNLNKH